MKHTLEIFENLIIENSLKIENCKLKILLIGLFVYLFIGLFSRQVFSASSSNPNYNLEIQDIDPYPQKKIPAPTAVPNPAEQNTPSQPTEKTGGIKSINTMPPFSFSISNSQINFGILSPANPIVRTTTLSISGDMIAYQIQAFSDHALSTSNGESIPDSTCDDGACSEQKDSIWKSILTYGYGFRCETQEGYACLSDHKNLGTESGLESLDYFRQFADISKNELSQTITKGILTGKEENTQITFKVNKSGTQKPGSFSNTVTFIAVPNF